MLRRSAHAVRTYIRKAPGTFIWLAILFASTMVLRHVSPAMGNHILERRSTNLHYLSQTPIRVLITSALWISGNGWCFYALIYQVFHVPAERWLGTWRWLSVCLIAHVGATFISQGVVYWRIHNGYASPQEMYTLDYGVSYALAGVVAVLTYRIVKPWRYLYCAGVLIFYLIDVLKARDFTSIGHFSAVLLGLACYPIARALPAQWDPVVTLETYRRHEPRYRRCAGKPESGSESTGTRTGPTR